VALWEATISREPNGPGSYCDAQSIDPASHCEFERIRNKPANGPRLRLGNWRSLRQAGIVQFAG